MTQSEEIQKKLSLPKADHGSAAAIKDDVVDDDDDEDDDDRVDVDDDDDPSTLLLSSSSSSSASLRAVTFSILKKNNDDDDVELVVEPQLLCNFLMELGACSTSITDANVGTANEHPLFHEEGVLFFLEQPPQSIGIEVTTATTTTTNQRVWDDCHVTAHFPASVSLDWIMEIVQDAFPQMPNYHTISMVEDNKDWMWHVQQSWKPIVCEPFFVLRFPWHTQEDVKEACLNWNSSNSNPTTTSTMITRPLQDMIQIELQGGIAFGTGEHPTTQMCLEFVVNETKKSTTLNNNMLWMDYGTGSGVLGIAACKLDDTTVQAIGVDVDVDAVRIANANAAMNHVNMKNFLTDVTMQTATEDDESTSILLKGYHHRQQEQVQSEMLPDQYKGPIYDACVANILTATLISLAPRLAGLLKPGAPIGLSGIMSSQKDRILESSSVFQEYFDDLVVQQERNGWVLIRGVRRRRRRRHQHPSEEIITNPPPPPLPNLQRSMLSQAMEDAAAAYTQKACTLLGVKSIGVDYGLVRTGVAVTVGYNPKPLDILVWTPPQNDDPEEIEKTLLLRKRYHDSDPNKNDFPDDRTKDEIREEEKSIPDPRLLYVTQIASQVLQIAEREQASQIIVGLPLHKNGTESEQTNHTRVFATELALQVLQTLGPKVRVYLWDERYTSKEASARAHSKDPNRNLYGTLDAEAACIILEHYYHDNGHGAECVTVPDDALVEQYTKEWKEKMERERIRLLQQEQEREDRLRRRNEAMWQDQQLAHKNGMLLQVPKCTENNGKKKKKRKRKK